jgi:hypothetical protein
VPAATTTTTPYLALPAGGRLDEVVCIVRLEPDSLKQLEEALQAGADMLVANPRLAAAEFAWNAHVRFQAHASELLDDSDGPRLLPADPCPNELGNDGASIKVTRAGLQEAIQANVPPWTIVALLVTHTEDDSYYSNPFNSDLIARSKAALGV